MLVRCSQAYALTMDGVEWHPIDNDNGADVYVLSTGGRCEITAAGKKIFVFTNDLVRDFSGYDSLTGSGYTTDGGTLRQSWNAGPDGYLQGKFNFSDVTFLSIRITPHMDVEQPITSSQGQTVQLRQTSPDYTVLRVPDVNPNQYLQINVGNTLVAFLLPFGN